MRTAILCAAAAFSLVAIVPAASAQRVRPDTTRWINIHQDSERLAAATRIIENSVWADGYNRRPLLEEAGLDCKTVRSNTSTFLAEVGVDFAAQTDTAEVGFWRGEYFDSANTILNMENTWVEDFRTIIHEAQHHDGWGTTPHDEAIIGAAEYCLTTIVKENEDEDPDPGEGGGDPPEPVCEEKLVAVYYTVYVREYRTGKTCLSSDDADGSTWCGGTVGTWVKVPKQKVKWETQTVCSS